MNTQSYIAPASPFLRKYLHDIYAVFLGLVLITIAAFVTRPLPPPGPIPTTMQIALVPLLGATLGHFRGYLIVTLYFVIALLKIPVFLYYFPFHQLPVFVFWWTGALIGYLFGIYVSGHIYMKRLRLGKMALIGFLFLADIALILPHFLWQWGRVNQASIFVVIQMVFAFVIQIIAILIIRKKIWKPNATSPNKTADPLPKMEEKTSATEVGVGEQ